MNSIDFELDIGGLRELMSSAEMQAQLEAAGKQVASIAGEGYGSRVHQGSYVAICNVYPDSPEAAHDNYENNTLMKSLGASGLSTSKG